MAITYSTNMMGPYFMDWYHKRGLVRLVERTVDSEFVADLRGLKMGDHYWIEEITTHYAGGRIDIYGVPNEPFPLEYGVALMHADDWYALGAFLDTLETEKLWTYEELINTFEEYCGRKIRWADES